MKKKTMALGGLLMAVAITAYSVSGTYAKYISQVDYTDEARVAKFQLNGADNKDAQAIDLFAKSYEITTKDGKKVYVNSLDNDKVIAPGTKGKATLSISGTFETAYRTFVGFDGAEEIVIYFGIDENGNVTEISDTESDATPYAYNPITYKVYGVEADGTQKGLALVTNGNIADGEFKGKENVYEAEAVTSARNEYTIEWSWDTVNKVEVDVDTGTVDGYGDAIYRTIKLSEESINKLDTYLGRKGNDKLVLNVQVVAEQVAEDYSEKTGA